MARRVTLKDTSPLVIKKADMEEASVSICRCGLSAEWPLCDDSHREARKEEPGRLYAYTRSVPEGKLVRKEVAPSEASESDPRPEGMEVA